MSSRTKSPLKLERKRWGLALMIVSSLSLTTTAISGAELKHNAVDEPGRISSSKPVIRGTLLLGPVESVTKNSTEITVLGTTIPTGTLPRHILPAEYVSVNGSVSASGVFNVTSVEVLDAVYAPGSSLVIKAGRLVSNAAQNGVARLEQVTLNGVSFPLFDEWVNSRNNQVALAIGTQSIAGAPIDIQTIATFEEKGWVRLKQNSRKSKASKLEIVISGIDGSGNALLSEDILNSGISVQGIDGSGAAVQGIDGSGASVQGIDGSGAAVQGIDGSGASVQGIDGSGAAVQGIDGSGASVQGIDGSGAAVQGIDGSGASVQGIDGPNAASQKVNTGLGG